MRLEIAFDIVLKIVVSHASALASWQEAARSKVFWQGNRPEGRFNPVFVEQQCC